MPWKLYTPDGQEMVEGPTASRPVATVMPWPGTSAPTGWALCDGQAVAVASFPDLFDVIGYSFGGAGATFNLPDMRDKFVLGANDVYPRGSTGGARTHSHTGAAHTHGVQDHTHDYPTHKHRIDHTHSTSNHVHGVGTLNVLASGNQTSSSGVHTATSGSGDSTNRGPGNGSSVGHDHSLSGNLSTENPTVGWVRSNPGSDDYSTTESSATTTEGVTAPLATGISSVNTNSVDKRPVFLPVYFIIKT